jgi:hypothetical protein
MKALVLLAFVGACAARPIDEIQIACAADTDCPSSTWCDLRYQDSVCRSLDGSGPPHIVFEGFVAGDNLVPTITVPSRTVTIHSFRLRNDGGSQADVEVEVTAPDCVDADSLVRSDGELVDEGESFDADFSVRPVTGCPSPATLTITATASDRPFAFTAMISMTP